MVGFVEKTRVLACEDGDVSVQAEEVGLLVAPEVRLMDELKVISAVN